MPQPQTGESNAELNANYLDQLKQYEFNFISLQNENDQLLSEIEELKQKISDSKLSSTAKYDELKKKNDDLVAKLATVEQLNAKYKAKLKQLLGKQKSSKLTTLDGTATVDEVRSTSCTPIPSTQTLVETRTVEIQTELGHVELKTVFDQLDELKTIAKNTEKENVENVSTRELQAHMLSQLKLLGSDISECLMSNQLKICLLKDNLQSIKRENERLLADKRDFGAKFEHNSAENAKHAETITQIRSEKLKLEEELAEINVKLGEQTAMLSATEQQNLKYKAKLKQLLKPKQQQQLSSGSGILACATDEARSGCTTPIEHHHSPAYRGELASVCTQTSTDEFMTSQEVQSEVYSIDAHVQVELVNEIEVQKENNVTKSFIFLDKARTKSGLFYRRKKTLLKMHSVQDNLTN